jgi:hypothetical protein
MTNRKQVTARKSSLDRQKSLAFKGFLQKTLLEKVRCGYGKCSYSGCYCQQYQGNASTCQN